MSYPRLIAAITVAASLCLSAVAQLDCPRERTKVIPAATTFGPPQNCPGAGFQLGGVQLQFPANTCPLHLIYTPAHEIAAPSDADTMVRMVAQDPITMVAFKCERSYFVIIPWGSTCVVDRVFNIGTVLRLTTVPCPKTSA
jgi:hypothetical protein